MMDGRAVLCTPTARDSSTDLLTLLLDMRTSAGVSHNDRLSCISRLAR